MNVGQKRKTPVPITWRKTSAACSTVIVSDEKSLPSPPLICISKSPGATNGRSSPAGTGETF